MITEEVLPSRTRESEDQEHPALWTVDRLDHLILLFGPQDCFLKDIERLCEVSLLVRGNRVFIFGSHEKQTCVLRLLEALKDRVDRGLPLAQEDLEGVIRLERSSLFHQEAPSFSSELKTRRRTVTPRSPLQQSFLHAVATSDLVFATGPAGTGKTYLAVACAVASLLEGRTDRIILSRPAVEAGERLGFLPGDMKDKIDPYLRPLYDALYDMLPEGMVQKYLQDGVLEIAPLAFMRGRTLRHAFIILDEAQNTSPLQMKMFLTRLGEGSRMVVTGDLTQVDLPLGMESGLAQATALLSELPGVCHIAFQPEDIIRHPLVARIVRAYAAKNKRTSES